MYPPILAEVAIGNVVESLTMPAWSAAVEVMIFIVEPGGWRAENASPASAST